MASGETSQVPVQLIQILGKINDNVAEVKERVIRLEAQDYQYAVRELRDALHEESKARRAVEDKLAVLQGRVAPMLAGTVMVITVILNYFIRTIHF